MPQIITDRLEALARTRIARRAQIAALPPQPARLNANLWHLTRKPWIHARRRGMLSLALGSEDPQKEILRTNTTVRETIIERFPGYTLDELLVMPELPADVADVINITIGTYDPAAPDTATLALYRPSGITRLLRLIIPYVGSMDRDAGSTETFSGDSVPAPCIIREFFIQPLNLGTTFDAYYEIEGIGIVASLGTGASSNSFSQGTSSRGIDQWVLSGSVTPRVRVTYIAAMILQERYPATFNLTVEPLLRVA